MSPRLSEKDVRKVLSANKVDPNRVSVLAIRGYYLDSIGKVGENDRMVYDDAHFIVWPDGVVAYKANTDPNGYRKGKGYGKDKGMACLKEGIWLFGTGLHKGTLAFRQCEPFTVIRDGIDGDYEDTGYHAINWHAGGNTSTSSLGCQTNPASAFTKEIRPLMYSLLARYDNPKQKNDRDELVHCFPYVLIHEKARRKNNLIVSRRFF